MINSVIFFFRENSSIVEPLKCLLYNQYLFTFIWNIRFHYGFIAKVGLFREERKKRIHSIIRLFKNISKMQFCKRTRHNQTQSSSDILISIKKAVTGFHTNTLCRCRSWCLVTSWLKFINCYISICKHVQTLKEVLPKSEKMSAVH